MIKITDRILVYILFVVLSVLSFVMIEGNRDARNAAHDAARAANSANITISSQEHINSHRVRNDAEHECLLVMFGDEVTVDKVTGWQACVNAKSEGTIDPETLE